MGTCGSLMGTSGSGSLPRNESTSHTRLGAPGTRRHSRRRYHELEHIIPEPVGRASVGGGHRLRRRGAQPTRSPDRGPRRPPVRRDDHGARGLLRARVPPGRGRRASDGGGHQRRRVRGGAQPGQPARRGGRAAGLGRRRPRRPDGVLGRQRRLGHRTCRRRPLLRDGQQRVALFHRPRFPDTCRGARDHRRRLAERPQPRVQEHRPSPRRKPVRRHRLSVQRLPDRPADARIGG